MTLETSWAIASAATGEEIARRAIKQTTDAPFSKNREATETAAQMSIEEGLDWLEMVVETHSAT